MINGLKFAAILALGKVATSVYVRLRLPPGAGGGRLLLRGAR